MDHVVLEASDPAESATWLASALGLSVSEVGGRTLYLVPARRCRALLIDAPLHRSGSLAWIS